MQLIVVMPAFNEAEGIVEFLQEINGSFKNKAVRFIVVDDKSSDGTLSALRRWGHNVDIEIKENETNLGHGPSTLAALKAGLDSGAQFVLSVDGDGQFHGKDLARVAAVLEGNALDVVEGIRTDRSDPGFRKLTSFATRFLVFARCGSWPQDANTPLRCYKREALSVLLDNVPPGSVTPNLWISSKSRELKLSISEVKVESLVRRGSQASGTMWGRGSRMLPNRRFLKFCLQATREWLLEPHNK